MITPEEMRVLAYLSQRRCAPVADVGRSCLAGTSLDWVRRVISHLDWLGYVTLYYGSTGEAQDVQITDKALRQVGRPAPTPCA